MLELRISGGLFLKVKTESYSRTKVPLKVATYREKDETATMSIRVRKSFKERIKHQAKVDGRSISNWINMVVSEYIAKNEK